VLHTHFHRDQCDGAVRLAALGARIGAPEAELGYFDADLFWRTRNIFDNYNTYNDFAAPLASIPVDRALADHEEFTWYDLRLRVVPAPGHTKGSIALVGEIDGRLVAFAGDTIHHSIRPWTLFDLEWGYGGQDGVVALSLTLQTLASLPLDVILPSHGEPVSDPSAACLALIRKLGGYHEWLHLYTYQGGIGYPQLPADTRVQPLTPHLWMNTTSFANSYTLVTGDGSTMFLDYGFPSHAHFSANVRFVEHTLDDLRKVAGLKTIEVVLPSHYHDDHVCGLQYLHDQYGAQLWVFENQEDILAHPEAYKITCLWQRPMTTGRVFGEGETFKWRDITFTAARTPGHTEYHCAVSFELDGRRIVHAGDTIGRGITGPRLGGPIFQNRFTPGDFLTSITKIREFEPDYVLTGHWGALHLDPAFLDEALRRARALNDVLWDLIAVPEEAGFAYDPNWATLYPYQITAAPGEPFAIEARIVNHLSAGARATVSLRLPEGWTSDLLLVEETIPRGGRGVLRFQVTAPAGPVRQVIAADITLNGRPFGPAAEGIVTVG